MQTDAERREIYDALEKVVGARPATLIMDAMPPADALRGEMSQLKSELRGEMAELRGEMVQLKAELRGEMAELRGEMVQLKAELRTEMADLKVELRGEMAEVRKEMTTLTRKVDGMLPRLVVANVGLAFATAGLVLGAVSLA